jgi:hypothetical protein
MAVVAAAAMLLAATAVAAATPPPAPPSPPGGCAPVAGDKILVAPCAAAQAEAQEFVAPAAGAAAGPIHMKVTYVEGLCLDAGGSATDDDGYAALTLAQCQPARKAEQSWQLTRAKTGALVHIKNPKSGNCVNLNSRGQIDLFTCDRGSDGDGGGDDDDVDLRKEGTQTWSVAAGADPGSVVLHPGTHSTSCLAACGSSGPTPPPTPPSPAPNALVTLADKYSPFVYQGVWAMSANGAARLLFEYPEPTRSEIMDLLFLPSMGTRWQGLKVEIGAENAFFWRRLHLY